MCKIYATLNFFSAVADNITVKTKRKSNMENNNFILCFATSPFYLLAELSRAKCAQQSNMGEKMW